MSSKKIQATKNYRLFSHSDQNRPFDLKKHQSLVDSMKEYGFLPEYPVIAARNGKGSLELKDGQHRLAIAETLGLPVFWIEASKDFDVAKVNTAQKPWVPRDYAEMFSKQGNKSYQDGLEFAEKNNLPIGIAFSLLAGTSGFANIKKPFYSGTFKIKDRAWAESVADIYCPLVEIARENLRNARFVAACMGVCRVEGFDGKRLLTNAERVRERLKAYATQDAYLDMLEDIYNFGRKQLVGLKSAATMAMRERNPVKNKKQDAA